MTEVLDTPAMDAVGKLDAAGNYAEAIDVLKRASAKGDLTAMSELAHRLLIGDRAPKSPKHALYFLTEAAKGHEPRATARLAALTAGGAYLRQDWQAALAMLGQAAILGDESARGQLACLQPDGAWRIQR